MSDGQCWVLMQSATHPECSIAPAPELFDSWDEALPPGGGLHDVVKGVYESGKSINILISWFTAHHPKSIRTDSDATAIVRYALEVGRCPC